MSSLDTVAQDKSSNAVLSDTVRAMFDKLVQEHAYFFYNQPSWNVAAAAVAPPVLATATVTSEVKSTATTELKVGGVQKSLTATDPLLLIAQIQAGDPNTLAAGSVRRWQVCWDGTNATTVITCRPSNDVVIATSPLGTAASALAQCRWPSLPPNGTTIVGVVDITNTTNPFIPGTTLLGAAGVTAAYHDGPTIECGLASLVSP